MITIVSGLPRSGTSLIMQMLHSVEPLTQLPVFWDREPNEDESNPRGYFEWTDAKELYIETNSKLLDVDGKIVKIFPQVWPCLSRHFRYRFIFVERPICDVAASQRLLCNRMGIQYTTTLEDELENVRWHARIFLRGFDGLILQHEELYNGIAVQRLADFFGVGRVGRDMMDLCVDQSLRHFTRPRLSIHCQ